MAVTGRKTDEKRLKVTEMWVWRKTLSVVDGKDKNRISVGGRWCWEGADIFGAPGEGKEKTNIWLM